MKAGVEIWTSLVLRVSALSVYVLKVVINDETDEA